MITRPTCVMYRSWPGRLVALTLGTAVTLGLLVSACSTPPPPNIGTGPRWQVNARTCPKSVPAAARGGTDLWVPAVPRGFNGAARLVPLQVPARAIVCAYIGPRSPAGKSGSVVLTGDLSGVMNDLAWVPPAPAPGAGGVHWRPHVDRW